MLLLCYVLQNFCWSLAATLSTVVIDIVTSARLYNSPCHVFGNKCMIVKYMQLCSLFSPFTFLCEGKWHEVVSKIITNITYKMCKISCLFLKKTQKEKVTYFFIPFSKVSRTSVEASLTYVLVDVPLIPEASLKLDRLDCSGTDRWTKRRNDSY